MQTPDSSDSALVSIIMGSRSDWPTMRHAAELLESTGISYEALVVSAHRTPQCLYDFAKEVSGRRLRVVTAGSGYDGKNQWRLRCATDVTAFCCDHPRAAKETRVHWYNKSPAFGRKLGHVNVQSCSASQVRKAVDALQQSLYGGSQRKAARVDRPHRATAR